MNNAMRKIVFLMLGLLLSGSFTMKAQEEIALKESELSAKDGVATLNLGADFVSRYIWRGSDYGNSPAIQPNLAFSWKGLTIGAWGSYAFAKHSIQINDTTIEDAGNYSEMDLYISYTFKWFTFMVFDYFTINGLNANEGNRYFDLNNKTTGHTIELCLAFDGTETFPLQVMACTFVFGDDKDKDSTGTYGYGTKNNFSTYLEVAYTFSLKRIGVDLKPFVGGIPFGSSWYGPYAGIINIGLNAKKEIPITKQYSLPVQASFVTNPQAQSIFLVFGISL